MDTNLFFREATLRICSSAKVDEFLFHSFQYIRKFIPSDYAAITVFDKSTQKQTVLATATPEGGVDHGESNWFVYANEKQIQNSGNSVTGHTLIVSKFSDIPNAKNWLTYGIVEKHDSLLSMLLFLEDSFLCGVHLFSRKSGIYKKKYADLLAMLEKPFRLALSNYLNSSHFDDQQFFSSDQKQGSLYDLEDHNKTTFVGCKGGLADVYSAVKKVAKYDSTVLFKGETGVGKDVLANELHRISNRKNGPFIKVNCGAIPSSLLDSELFGHEKGSFTGAQSLKLGRFERANGGTIFLDEVGELSGEAQVRLLRVLQNREFERIGGNKPISLDIRVLAATNRNLADMVRDGYFRKDLYYRLNVFPIHIPALRDRRNDIPVLVDYCVKKKSRELNIETIPSVPDCVLQQFVDYHWPGNVRELENMIERSLIMKPQGPLIFDQPKDHMEIDTYSSNVGKKDLFLDLDTVNKEHIESVLHYTEGRINGSGGAAEILKINPNTLRHRIRKLGIE